MSQITFHPRPDGIFVEIPEGQKIDAINPDGIMMSIQKILADQFYAKVQSMSFVDLVAMSIADGVGLSEASIVYEEIKARLDRLSAHDRIRLGMVK